MGAIHERVGLDREIFGPIVLDNEMGKVLNLSQLWNLVGLGFIGHLLECRTICPNHFGMNVWRRGSRFPPCPQCFCFLILNLSLAPLSLLWAFGVGSKNSLKCYCVFIMIIYN